MIQLNHRDVRPIYEQVQDGLRRLVVTGAIAQGEKLPSVRQLASQLAINPNTIQRAYEALEREGYLYSIKGKGSFASAPGEVDTRRQQELLNQFDALVTELLYLETPTHVLVSRIQERGDEK